MMHDEDTVDQASAEAYEAILTRGGLTQWQSGLGGLAAGLLAVEESRTVVNVSCETDAPTVRPGKGA